MNSYRCQWFIESCSRRNCVNLILSAFNFVSEFMRLSMFINISFFLLFLTEEIIKINLRFFKSARGARECRTRTASAGVA